MLRVDVGHASSRRARSAANEPAPQAVSVTCGGNKCVACSDAARRLDTSSSPSPSSPRRPDGRPFSTGLLDRPDRLDRRGGAPRNNATPRIRQSRSVTCPRQLSGRESVEKTRQIECRRQRCSRTESSYATVFVGALSEQRRRRKSGMKMALDRAPKLRCRLAPFYA